MFEIVHDVEAFHEKLNKVFIAFGVPLKSEDLFTPDFRCVGIFTDKDNLYKAQSLLKEAGIETMVNTIPVELDWTSHIYYLNVRDGQILKALSFLERMKFQDLDISSYLENLAIARSRTEYLLIWSGLIFVSVVTIFMGFVTIDAIIMNRWASMILFGLLTIGLTIGCVIIGYLLLKSLKEKRRDNSRVLSRAKSKVQSLL